MDDDLDLSIGAVSDPGLVRLENEDAVGYELPDDAHIRRTRGALFVVCDGIGSLRAGQYASRLAANSFLKAYYGGQLDSPEGLLRRAAALSNNVVYQSSGGQGGSARMGATVVVAAVRMMNLWVLNVGDSRAYLWRQGVLQQLSRDHTPGDRIKADDRRINRALGTDPQVTPYVHGPVPLAPGDRVLLCTDGLTTEVAEPTIARTIGELPAPQAAFQLIEQAKTAGARDNVSVVLVGVPERVEAHPARTVVKLDRILGQLRGLRTALEQLRWIDLDPFRLLMAHGWRTARGAAILLGWLAAALVLGLVLGHLLSR